jgi:DNA repair photolyase
MGCLSPRPSMEKSPLVGIARMAAESPRVRERAEVEYFRLDSRSTLNRQSGSRMPFAWTINPFRGCEFGCHYCYARYTHEFMEMWDSKAFERKIYFKAQAAELLRAELRHGREKGLPIALGTATDPYQPAEKQFEITRRILQVIAEFRGLDLSITTKSVLILRDLDILRTIAKKHRLSIHMTVVTVDERLARLLEPKAPPPAKRLEAVRTLTDAGIRVCVNAMPILPGLNDSERMLDALAAQAAGAGACTIHGNVLFLMPSSMKAFMPFLEKEFPRLVQQYRKLYARSAYLRGEYPEKISALFKEIRARYGLTGRREDDPATDRRPQMAFSFGTSAVAVDTTSAAVVDTPPVLTACHNARSFDRPVAEARMA